MEIGSDGWEGDGVQEDAALGFRVQGSRGQG